MRRTSLLQRGGVLSFLLVALLAWGSNTAPSAAKFSRENLRELWRQEPGSVLRQKIERVENGLLPPAVIKGEPAGRMKLTERLQFYKTQE